MAQQAMRFVATAVAFAAFVAAASSSVLDSSDHVSMAVGSGATFVPADHIGSKVMRREVSQHINGASQLEVATEPEEVWATLLGFCSGETSQKRYGPHCSGQNEAGTACEGDAAQVNTLAKCKMKCGFDCKGIAWSLQAAGAENNEQCIVFIGACADSGAGSGNLNGLTYYQKPALPAFALENWVSLSGKCAAFADFKRYGKQCSGTTSGRECEVDKDLVTNIGECKARCTGTCKAIAWLAVADHTKTDQCLTYFGECPDSGPGTNNDGLVYYEKPFVVRKRLPGEDKETRCNTFTCPDGWYLRKDAPDIRCKADTCTLQNDRSRCCKALSKEGTGKKCARATALNWFSDWTMEECVEWAMNNGVSFFAYGTGKKAKRCWWQRSTAPPFCQGDSCCHCGEAWVAQFTKLKDGTECGYHFQAEPAATSAAACATACRSVPNCPVFSYGADDGCRVSMKGKGSTSRASGTGLSGYGLDATQVSAGCGAKAKANVALYKVKVKQEVTYTLPAASLPVTAVTHNIVTLTPAQWPKNFCVDFDITFPDKQNGNQFGYGGSIALMGSFYIALTHTTKLIRPGTGFGFCALEQSNGNGPYYCTAEVGAAGTRHKATFCYLASINRPVWEVEGKTIQADYLYNRGAEYPTARNVPLTIFAGSHTNQAEAMGDNAKLHSFDVKRTEACTMEKDEYDFYKLA